MVVYRKETDYPLGPANPTPCARQETGAREALAVDSKTEWLTETAVDGGQYNIAKHASTRGTTQASRFAIPDVYGDGARGLG